MKQRHVTTTHDPGGGGRPRLIFAAGPSPWPGDEQNHVELVDPVTTIGSSPDADLCLPGCAEQHAQVRHDSADEFVLVDLSQDQDTRVNGEQGGEHLLRTGTRIELGGWTLTFYREEYADHGRPYGGRVGGELGHQRTQPPRKR